MTIGNVQGTYDSSSYVYTVKCTTEKFAEDAEYKDKLGMRKTSEESGIIGLTMIPYSDSISYGVYARYAEESTIENPVVEVVSNYGDEKTTYKVNINEVNPSNASMMEMFALLSYADAQGLTPNTSAFDSFQQFKTYTMNAGKNGYCVEVSGLDDFLKLKMDWTNAIESIGQDYMEAGLFGQYQNTQYLLRFLNDKIEEMQKNIASGNVGNEPVIAVGGNAYTEEEWDKLLEQVDEVEAEIQKTAEEEKENWLKADFEKYAPNAPDEVKQAFFDAANETGYYEGGRMDYISQVFIHQVENRNNGLDNYNDVFGNSIYSALQTANEILNDLENPLLPNSQRGKNTANYVEEEKAFYKAFIQKLENLLSLDIEDTEASHQFLDEAGIVLTSEYTSSVYYAKEPEDDVKYITWYSEEGIFCRKAGQTEGYEWSISFENEEQYKKVMEFIQQFPGDWNMRFASHENFWTDFLSDEIDMDSFMEFMSESDNGIPNYFMQKGDSVFIDTEKTQWTKYFNSLESISKELRPVDDMMEVLRTPINLADRTFINKINNVINLASGTSISVAGGFVLTITERGVEVSGVTDFGNQKEAQEAQDMAGALATLLRNAGGTMKYPAHSSEAYGRWTENVTKVLKYFGIDATDGFTINGTKYQKNEKGWFEAQR